MSDESRGARQAPVPAAATQATCREYPEAYYEYLARSMGEEQAAWARLSPAEREAELERIHATSDSPDDLALWPPELSGGTLQSR